MSDELMIQPQIAQPYKKDNSALYGGIGAVAGAGLGYLGAEKLTGKYATHEDIIKDIQDKVDLKTKYPSAEEATIKGLTDAAKEVEDAKAALETAKKPALPDTAKEVTEFNDAKKAYDDAFNKYLEEGKAKYGGSTTVTGGGKFPSKKTLEDSLTKSEYKIVEPYLNDYERARRNLVGSPGARFAGGTASGAYNELNNAKSTVETLYDDIYTNYKGLSKKKQANYDPKKGFAKGKIKNYINTILPETGYDNRIRTYKDFLEHQERFGEEIFSLVDEKPTRKNIFDKTPIISVTKDGKKQWVQIDYDAIKEKRVNLFDEMAENVNRMNDLSKQSDEFNKKFFKENKDALKLDLHTPINTQADLSKLKKPGQYTQELKKIDFVKNGLESKSLRYPQTFSTIHGTTIYVGNKGDLKKLDKYRRQTEAGFDLSSQWWKDDGNIKKEIGEIVKQDPVVQGAQKKFQRTVAEDKGIKNVLKKMERELSRRGSEKDKEVYEKVMGMIGETETVVDSDAEAKAKEFAEGKTKDLKKAMEEKQGLLDKAKSEKGAVNEEAVKKAEEFLKGKQGAYDNSVKAFAEKLPKVGGMNKWLGAGIGLGVAGLAAYLATKPSND